MLRRLFSPEPVNVDFRDGAASVCDDRCRSDSILDRARTRAIETRLGVF